MCDTILKNPLLSGQFNRFKASYGISEENSENAFRRFVNYTLFRLDDPDVFVGKIEWLDFVCAGELSPEYDGIGIQVNGNLVRSSDDIEQLMNASEKLEIDIVFVKIGYDIKDDKKVYSEFCENVLSFFKTNSQSSDSNLMPYHELVDFIYSDKRVASQMDIYPRLKLWFVPAHRFVESDFEETKNIILSNTQSEDYYLSATDLFYVSGKDLVEYCKELDNKFSCCVKFKEQFPLAVNEAKINNAISFTCSAHELLNLMVREDGTLRRSLFNDNVRDYLGYTVVNAEIEDTIRDNPDMFLLCNNGITIVCGKFELIKNKTICIDNPQIVNGCQTCNSLYKLRKESTFDRVQVQVRLIWTDNNELTSMIVRGTNKQNNVLDEAFETLRSFHQYLESYFDLRIKATPQEVKLYYERRSKQYSDNPAISKYQIVNLRIITQVFVAMFMGLPHIAHRHEAKLLEEFAGEKRVIYNNEHSFLPYFVCAYAWYSINLLFRNGLLQKKYRVYTSHLYLLLRYSCKTPMPSFDDKDNMSLYCEELMAILLSDDLPQKMSMIIDTFNQVLDIWTKQGGSIYAVKDRKDFTDLMTIVASNQSDGMSVMSKSRQVWYYGKVLRFNNYNNGNQWFAVVKPDSGGRNLTFDSRDYEGQVREIIPGRRVKYILRENKTTGIPYAWKVEFVEDKNV